MHTRPYTRPYKSVSSQFYVFKILCTHQIRPLRVLQRQNLENEGLGFRVQKHLNDGALGNGLPRELLELVRTMICPNRIHPSRVIQR